MARSQSRVSGCDVCDVLDLYRTDSAAIRRHLAGVPIRSADSFK